MRIPIDIIYAITDQLYLPGDSQPIDPENEKALQACALACQSFVRPSQKRLFSRISVSDYNVERMSAVLSSSPHLGGYIRILKLSFSLGSELLESFAQILGAVTALDTLILESAFVDRSLPFDIAAQSVFTLPTLRCVELRHYQFRDPFELESLLRPSASLRKLKLVAIDFGRDKDVGEAPTSSHNSSADFNLNSVSSGHRLILESLNLVNMKPPDVKSMFQCFTKVDIKHLTSLVFNRGPVTGLLRANAGSIQDITVGAGFGTQWPFWFFDSHLNPHVSSY
jgi:hypothetical protein